MFEEDKKVTSTHIQIIVPALLLVRLFEIPVLKYNFKAPELSVKLRMERHMLICGISPAAPSYSISENGLLPLCVLSQWISQWLSLVQMPILTAVLCQSMNLIITSSLAFCLSTVTHFTIVTFDLHSCFNIHVMLIFKFTLPPGPSLRYSVLGDSSVTTSLRSCRILQSLYLPCSFLVLSAPCHGVVLFQ